MEKQMRSRWVSGVSAAARQISRMRSGSCSDFRRERAAFDLSLAESGVEELGERIEEKKRQRRTEMGRRRWRKAMNLRGKETLK